MTYKELQTFYNVADAYIRNHKEENKFSYALKKLLKQGRSELIKLNEDLEDLDIEYCSTNKDGNMSRDAQGRLEFTKAGIRKRNEAREVLMNSTVNIAPHFAEPPSGLTEIEVEVFTGFVIEKCEDEEGNK